MLRSDITDDQLRRILLHTQWPQRPFWRVALQLGLAKIKQTYISEFEKVRLAIRQVELLENPGGDLCRRMEDLRQLLKQKGREQDPRARQELVNQIEEQREATGVLALKNLHSLQKLEGAPRVRHVLGLLRKYIPKYFFKAVNRQLSFNQGQQIMQHFRSEVDGDQITEAQPFPDYFAELYTQSRIALQRI